MGNEDEIEKLIQDNKIKLIEKDVSILAIGQRDIKKCNDTLTTKIESLGNQQASQSIIIQNTHDTVTKFIEDHKDDTKNTIRWMVRLVWCVILATLMVGGSLAGFIGYQNNTINKIMNEKFEIMREFYDGKTKQTD